MRRVIAVLAILFMSAMPVYAQEDCGDPNGWLEQSGIVVYSGTNARMTVTNLSQSCTVNVGLASYKMVGMRAEYYSSVMKSVAPGQTRDFDVPYPLTPDPGYIFAYSGETIHNLTSTGYGLRTLDVAKIRNPVPIGEIIFLPFVER